MSNKPLLSIIIPVYNTARYLERCLNSILKQTYKNLEIILVNDCSTDNSLDIINRYIELDQRVKSISHNENKGLFQARISGVEEASGEYIAFVDSDDFVSIDYYRTLINKAIETNSDMVLSDWAYEYEDGRREILNFDGPRNLELNLEKEEILKTFMSQKGLCFSWQLVWNKIYKKTLWNKCYKEFKQFSDKHGHLIMTEDIAFSCVFWMYAQKVTNVHEVLYFYSQNQNQSTATSTSFERYDKNLNDVIGVFDFFENILKSHDKFALYENEFIQWKRFYGKIYYGNSLNTSFAHSIKEKLKNEFNIKELSSLSKEDNFFYSQKTSLGDGFKWLEDIKEYISSIECEYVSFDIFDSLILRPFFLPTDLFYLMNDEFIKLTGAKSYIDFAQMRIEAEKRCREKIRLTHPGYEDVTLDEIYLQLQNDYYIDSEILAELKNKEIELEIQFCNTRNIGKELYNLAYECNKKIILISDMYLPLSVINKILDKNGYNYHEKVFLSSEIRLGKWTGNLYKYVLKELEVDNPSNIGHIGDNWDSDIMMAKKAKIKSFHITKAIDLFKNLNPGIYTGKSFEKIFMPNGREKDMQGSIWGFVGFRSMLAVVANRIFDNPFYSYNEQSDFNGNPYYIGYFTLGMHLYAVADWLLKEARHKDSRTIHFVARDGYILQKAYDIMTKGDSTTPNSNYIYLSRKALALIDVYTKIDVYSLINKMNIFKSSPKKVIDMFREAIKEENLIGIQLKCNEKGFVYEKGFSSRYEYEKFVKFLVEELVEEELLIKNKEKLKKYFSTIIDKDDLLFDIGYSGRAEVGLSSLLGFPINSYYIHSNSDVVHARERVGNFTNNTFYSYKPAITGVMREHMFMQMGPSTIGYDFEAETIKPIFEEYEIDYATQFMTDIVQNAALDFVRDFTTLFNDYKDILNYRKEDASQPFEYYLHYAKNLDKNIFSNLVFEDEFGEGKRFYAVDFWQKDIAHFRLETLTSNTGVNSISNELVELYQDGLLVAFIKKINEFMPKGSRKREVVKKVAGKFMK